MALSVNARRKKKLEGGAQLFETRGHDLTGYASIDFYDKDDFNSFAASLAGYNPNRFEPVALRVFVQKGEPLVTLFALDTFRQERSNYPANKLPVKKFRFALSWDNLFHYVKRFDFTVSNESYPIADMLVMNK
jgi:hypothetical protein